VYINGAVHRIGLRRGKIRTVIQNSKQNPSFEGALGNDNILSFSYLWGKTFKTVLGMLSKKHIQSKSI